MVMTTAATTAAANQLAQQLVEAELAACVQIISPITSVYRWQGKVETSAEALLLIKTTPAAYDDLEEAIKELHSYQTPEVIALPVTAGSVDYLTWVQTSVKNGA